MKKYIPILIAAYSLATFSAFAQPAATAPTDESLKQLLELSGSKKLVDDMQKQLQAVFTQSMNQTLANQKLTPEAQEKVKEMQSKLTALMMEELSWENLEGLTLQVYKETFSQEEIDGLITFYKSPTGKTFIAKMPTVMKKTIALTQERIKPLMQKVQAIQQETFKELSEDKPAPSEKSAE